MSETILAGKGHEIVSMPSEHWEAHLKAKPKPYSERFPFMTDAHQQVRYFAVRELPRIAKPLEPAFIAAQYQIKQRIAHHNTSNL